jgi:hypothetical protein
MVETRAYLLKKGMKSQYADLLASKYIKKCETDGHIVTIMNLFDTKRDDWASMKSVLNSPMEYIALNYQTLSHYQKSVNYHLA